MFQTDNCMLSLRALALGALARMYRPDLHLFAFRLRRDGGEDVLEGVSRRYTAIALIGLAGESDSTVRDVLGATALKDVLGRLVADVGEMDDLGEVALTLWAGRLLRCDGTEPVVRRMADMLDADRAWPTVETSWALSALCPAGQPPADAVLADRIAARLIKSFCRKANLFPHWPDGADSPRLRGHVSCFADFVYPVQALAYYHRATGSAEALDVSARCAEHMCRLQGGHGQWWWHFDVRSGRVLEKYPVYAVHQDAMAPMALAALRDAGGPDHADAVRRGLAWLAAAAEIGGSLVDEHAGVIWRKVARREPGKLVRAAQALASRLHPTLRVPGLGLVFRPGFIDYETRPYHMGWILHAWPDPTGAHAGGAVTGGRQETAVPVE